MEEKFFVRKTDKKVFKLLDIKHFLLNNEIKETGTKFGIGFDIYLMQADDGEMEAEIYPIIKDSFEEVKKEKPLGTHILKEIENFLGYENDTLILDIEYKKSTISFNNEITRVILPALIDSVSVDYENVITIVYYTGVVDKKIRMVITHNNQEHKHILELYNNKYREIIQSASI